MVTHYHCLEIVKKGSHVSSASTETETTPQRNREPNKRRKSSKSTTSKSNTGNRHSNVLNPYTTLNLPPEYADLLGKFTPEQIIQMMGEIDILRANSRKSVPTNAENIPPHPNDYPKNAPNHTSIPPVAAHHPPDISAVVAADKAKKQNKNGKKDEVMKAHIKNVVKAYIWKIIKFVKNEKTQRFVAQQVLLLLKFGGYEGESDTAKALREEWVQLYQGLCTTVLNETRAYVQGRIKTAAMDWMDNQDNWVNGKPAMPDLKILHKCLDRTIDLDDDNEYKHFHFWWTQVMPKATAHKDDWNPEKSNYMTIGTAAPPGSPTHLYLPPSTEAFALAVFESNEKKWPRMHQLMQKPEYKNKTLQPKVKKNDVVMEQELVSLQIVRS